MKHVRLGSTGVRVSPLCLGMMTYVSKTWREWVLDEDEARPFVQRAIEALELRLTGEEVKRLEEPYEPHPVLGHS